MKEKLQMFRKLLIIFLLMCSTLTFGQTVSQITKNPTKYLDKCVKVKGYTSAYLAFNSVKYQFLYDLKDKKQFILLKINTDYYKAHSKVKVRGKIVKMHYQDGRTVYVLKECDCRPNYIKRLLVIF